MPRNIHVFFIGMITVIILYGIGSSAPNAYSPKTMRILPFPYAIPDEHIVDHVPEKVRVLSEVIPGTARKYSYKAGEEAAYYKQYQESRFAVTTKKGGWDCLRHYEILAAGCIPLFKGIEECPPGCLVSFPKELVREANERLWPWVETPETIELYNSYVKRLLDHCRSQCSTSALAERFLELSGRPRSVLMLSCNVAENYSRELLAIGLRRRLGEQFIEAPRLDVLYRGSDMAKAYGNGFTYGARLEDIPVSRDNLENRIRAREFDVIIYGKVGHHVDNQGYAPTLPYWQAVKDTYPKDRLYFLFGGDGLHDLELTWQHDTKIMLKHAEYGTCLIRELDA